MQYVDRWTNNNKPFFLQGLPIYEVAFLIFFLIPIIVLTILYILMALAIRKTRMNSLRGSVHGGHSNDNKKQIIRMLGRIY